MEEERVRIKGNGHYLHRSPAHYPTARLPPRPSPAIPELLDSWLVRSSWSEQKRMGIHPSMVNGGSQNAGSSTERYREAHA